MASQAIYDGARRARDATRRDATRRRRTHATTPRSRVGDANRRRARVVDATRRDAKAIDARRVNDTIARAARRRAKTDETRARGVIVRSGRGRTRGHVRPLQRGASGDVGRGHALRGAVHSEPDDLRRAHASEVADVGDGDEGFAAGELDAAGAVQTGRGQAAEDSSRARARLR